MHFKFQQTSEFTKVLIIAQFFLLSYLMYTLTLSVYENYQIDRRVQLFSEENELLEKQNMLIASDIEYGSSEAYTERKNKENEGLVNPGEEVVVVPKVSDVDEDLFLLDDAAPVKKPSNAQIWWDFVFKRDAGF